MKLPQVKPLQLSYKHKRNIGIAHSVDCYSFIRCRPTGPHHNALACRSVARFLGILLGLSFGTPVALAEPSPETSPPAPRLETTDDDHPPLVQALEVVFTSDIQGRYAWPGCDKRATGHAELSQLIGAVRSLRQQARSTGQAAPIVVAGGSSIRPDALGNYLFSTRSFVGPRAASLLHRVGFDALVVGIYDFGARTETLSRYTALMRNLGETLLVGNVFCNDPLDPRCNHLESGDSRHYRIVERAGVRIAILSVTRADLLVRILGASGRSMAVVDPVIWSRKMITKLRHERHVDVVIALADLNAEDDAPGPIIDYVRKLGDAAPDLIVANAMYDPANGSYISHVQHGRTTIVGTDRFAQHLGVATITVRPNDDRFVVDSIAVKQHDTVDYPPDAAAAADLNLLLRTMCRDLDWQLGHALLRVPMDRSAFLDYALHVLQQQTHTEVAVLNVSSTASTLSLNAGRMTWEKLVRALRTESTFGTVYLLGSRIIDLLGRYATGAANGARVLGLQQRGGEWMVNGRPVITGQRYRVAMTAFLAAGGENLIALDRHEHFRDRRISLRRLLSSFFEHNRQARDHDPSLDAQTDFPDLRDRLLLNGSIDVGLSVSNLAINNGPEGDRYSMPQLRRDRQTSVTAEVKLSGGASVRSHTLNLDLQLQYGESWTRTVADTGEHQTVRARSADRVTGTLIYVSHLIRDTYGVQRWYLPDPFAEGRLTTEIRPSGVCEACGTTPSEQRYRYMDLGGIAGLGLTLHPLFFFKVGAVMRGELLTPAKKNPDVTTQPGIYLGYLLRRVDLFAVTEHPLRIDSRLDYFFTDLTGGLRNELNVRSTLTFGLTRMFGLTATHNFYLFDTGDRALALANDISVGLALNLDFRRQTF